MKKSQANALFIEACYGDERKLHEAIKADYLAVQLQWSFFIDSLCRNGDITLKQYNSWTFPWRR